MTLSEHPSSSLTQLRAEKEIVEALARRWDIDLRLRPGKVMVADGVAIEVAASLPSTHSFEPSRVRQAGAPAIRLGYDPSRLPTFAETPNNGGRWRSSPA